MWFKKPINPILVCPLIALLFMALTVLMVFQLSQLLFINHYEDYNLYDEDSYWNRRRAAFGMRTHRTDNELDLAGDRQILIELISDSQPNRNIRDLVDRKSIRLKHRLVRRAEDSQPNTKQFENLYLKEIPPPKEINQYNRQAPRGGWPMLNLSVGQTKIPIFSVENDYPSTQSEPTLYDFFDDFGNGNLNAENAGNTEVSHLNEGSGMDRYLVDASVISDEEGEFRPPLSRIVLLH